jgi:NAD(P)-dependent dehydrogenase (short-subunit alcohol dehydrogenase family)
VVHGDLGDEAGCRAVLDDAWGAWGELDILVNNAAVFHKDGLHTASLAALESEVAVDFLAPVFLTQQFAERRPVLSGTEPGQIVNLLDRRVAGVDPDTLPYSIAKKMLAEYTRASALELAPGVAVNAVAPGPVLPPPGSESEHVADMAGDVPLRVRCTPEDVAAAVVFLLESDTITGQTIFVDGGQHLRA